MAADRLTSELRALTEAGISLTSELSLDAVLQKLVDVARDQVNARYGALSVMGPGGDIEKFMTSGITEAERLRIGALPEGRGLLGVLLHEGSSLRLRKIAEDPRSFGFPPNHPPMDSLLGVPVVSGGRVIGNLYLSDKQGAAEFSEADEETVRLLAAQAAAALRNAELYEAATRRAAEWKALFELGRDVAASPDLQKLLGSTVSRARRLLGTDVAVLMLLAADRTSLHLAAHEGLLNAEPMKLRRLEEHSQQRLTLQRMEPVIVEEYATDHRLRGMPAALVDEEQLISLISVPLAGKAGPLGTLTVGERERRRFTQQDAELLEAFGNWTGVAIEASRLYEKMESLARLEERERIGMDLHDGVIQSIYAVGLGLEDVLERLETDRPEELRPGVEKAMQDLTRIIKEIRSYIFDLRAQLSQVTDLPLAVQQLVDDLRVNTTLTTEVDTDAADTTKLSEKQALALFHIAQEALNNVSKHSGATQVRVRLSGSDGQVSLEIDDNGKGFDPEEAGAKERQGLRNMRDRARSVGGELEIESATGKGTRIRAKVSPP